MPDHSVKPAKGGIKAMLEQGRPSGRRLLSICVVVTSCCVVVPLVAPALSVAATTGEQLTAMPVTEPFDGSTESLSNFTTKWSKLGWAKGAHPKGEDTTSGWRSSLTFANGLTGSYYNPSISDTGQGIAAVATMAVNPELSERFFSIWLDLQTPGTIREGYELRFTDTAANTYEVRLAKWTGNVETLLASKAGYTFVNGNSFAIVDNGSSVSAWTDTGSGFTQLLSASDSAYSSGNSGIQAKGNVTRLNKFKAGSLRDIGASLTAMPVTEPFDGSTESLSNFETKWSKLGWATGTTPKGLDTTTGWRAKSAFTEGPNGAYYNPSLSDTGQAVAAVATMAVNPEAEERYFSIWLDLQSPGAIRAGYELRFTKTDIITNTYEVRLAKWTGGSQTLLASKAGYTFVNGNSFAIVDNGSSVSAWTNTGSGFISLLSASDSAYSSGNSGIEARGNLGFHNKFKAGSL